MNPQQPNKPMVNCHTHVFTGEHVPPYLAKSFIPLKLYYLFPLHPILRLYKLIHNMRMRSINKPNSLRNRLRFLLHRIRKTFIGKALIGIITAWFVLNAAGIMVITWVGYSFPGWPKWVTQIIDLLIDFRIILLPKLLVWQILIVLVVVLFIESGRNLLLFLGRKFFWFIRLLPGKKTTSLIKRYILIGKYTMYRSQRWVYTKLRHQYPDGTRFVVLPMDMAYMGAGKVPASYRSQMKELMEMKSKGVGKDTIEPFIFIDPRRITGQPGFLEYTIEPGKVTLENCEVKEYLDHDFSGFKIYPALGYYPFDEVLLPLWKWAADHQYPIMTHCISGTIFYRGRKKKEWYEHPVFRESDGKGNTRPLTLRQTKNIEFSVNFGHPLNYLCLLEEQLLRQVVAKAKDPKIKELFGYIDEQTPLKYDLRNLKVCLAHFGGEEEWERYLEADRFPYAQRLIRERTKGINFHFGKSSLNWNVMNRIWRHVDWYSIICSLIVQYPNVYADISYILSKPRIMPLLKETLDPKLNWDKKNNRETNLRKRVLFGTDFYVVRNHFSEKDLLAQLKASLSEEEFDLIAKANPDSFLRYIT